MFVPAMTIEPAVTSVELLCINKEHWVLQVLKSICSCPIFRSQTVQESVGERANKNDMCLQKSR